jgi:hypothetical protein
MGLAGGNNGVLRALLLVVVAIASAYTGGAVGAAYGSAYGAVAAVAVSVVGSMLVNAIAPLPTPGGGNTGPDRQWNQLTGTSNQINPWGPIPIVLGESRYFPPHAAIPYSESVGSDSFQYCMFDLGYGDLEASDFRIGESPFSSYTNLQYQINKNPTIYTSDVAEAVVNFSLTEDGDNATRTTANGVDSISLDILFQSGLIGFGTSGKDFDLWVVYRIQYRPTGTSTWLNPTQTRLSKMVSSWFSMGSIDEPPGPGKFMVKTKDKNPFAAGIAWSVPVGQYDVRVERIKAGRGSSDNTYVDAAVWTLLRSIKKVSPSSTGTNKLTMRIKATDQVTGTLQTLSCLVRQKIKVYSRTTGWSVPAFNLNPAWVCYWLMTECEALSKNVPASRIDLDSFADFADFCTTHQLETRDCQDSATTAGDLLRKTLANALSSIGQRDGKYCVVYDPGVVSAPRMTFSPMEITSFSESRVFVVPPEALRVQFKNPDADWQEDEVMVIRDGFSYLGYDARGNPSTAPSVATFQTLRLEQAMLPRQAWRIGRYQLAQSVFRQVSYTWSSDIAGVSTTRGDVVDVCHDVSDSWVGGGRVLSFSNDAPPGFTGTVTIDTRIPTDSTKNYSIQFIRAPGDSFIVSCTPSSINTETFYLTQEVEGVDYGLSALIGLAGVENKRVVVTSIKYGNDYTSTFTGVDYDPRVSEYWSNPPADIVTSLSGRVYDVPAPPVVTGVTSGVANDVSDDAGIRTATIRVATSEQSNYLMLN